MIDDYLARLGLDHRPSPTLEALVDLQHRHLDRVPYENLAIVLGRPDTADPAAALARVAVGGNAGYCLQHNGALELALRGLGFAVERWAGAMVSEDGVVGPLDHLAVLVTGLPTDANPGGVWWPDLGYGDAARDPLPLVEGHHRQGGFTYRLRREAGSWRLLHDPRGSFYGSVLRWPDPSQAAIDAAHTRLSGPGGQFTRRLVVQRRDATGAETLRGLRHTRVGDGSFARSLRDYDDWRAALTRLGVSLAGVPDDELRALHRAQRF